MTSPAERIAGFERYYESIAKPFEWKFTRRDLAGMLGKPTVRHLSGGGMSPMDTRMGCLGSPGIERPIEVAAEIVGVLETDRQADKRLTDPGLGAFLDA